MGEKMTNAQAAEILRQHNAWRRGNDDEMPDAPVNPTRLGKAIDHAVAHLTQPAQAVDVRFFASGPEGHFYADDHMLATQLISRAGFDRDDWTITDIAALPNANGKEGV